MKKLTTLLFLLLSATAIMAQQSVAVMDVKVAEGTVSAMNKMQIRGALEKGITQSPGYKAYNRTALDRIAKELAFQRSGEVSDDQIRELGKKAGVDYILTTEVAKSGNNMYVNVNVLNIETGEYENSDNTLIENATDGNIQTKCIELAQSLFGGGSSASSKSQTPAGYTDLGLPSGTKWKNNNESGFYTYDDAVRTFGNKLPTKAQLEELQSSCNWTWTSRGYKVTGPNGNSIVLPATGYRGCGGSTRSIGSCGIYRSSTPGGSGKAWFLYFCSGEVDMGSGDQCSGGSIRLIYHE